MFVGLFVFGESPHGHNKDSKSLEPISKVIKLHLAIFFNMFPSSERSEPLCRHHTFPYGTIFTINFTVSADPVYIVRTVIVLTIKNMHWFDYCTWCNRAGCEHWSHVYSYRIRIIQRKYDCTAFQGRPKRLWCVVFGKVHSVLHLKFHRKDTMTRGRKITCSVLKHWL